MNPVNQGIVGLVQSLLSGSIFFRCLEGQEGFDKERVTLGISDGEVRALPHARTYSWMYCDHDPQHTKEFKQIQFPETRRRNALGLWNAAALRVSRRCALGKWFSHSSMRLRTALASGRPDRHKYSYSGSA